MFNPMRNGTHTTFFWIFCGIFALVVVLNVVAAMSSNVSMTVNGMIQEVCVGGNLAVVGADGRVVLISSQSGELVPCK